MTVLDGIGGGFLYITDSSVGLDEEEFEPDSYEIEKPLSKCMDKLEIGNFFMDVNPMMTTKSAHLKKSFKKKN